MKISPTHALADRNSLALERLSRSPEVRELSDFLGQYEDRLNQHPPGDHHFYRATVPLDAHHTVIDERIFEETREGWLTLDRDGIHLVQQDDYCMGEECFFHDYQASVRPWWGVRQWDTLMGNKNRDVLAEVDLEAVKARLHAAAQEAKSSPNPKGLISVLCTQRYNNVFSELPKLP